MVDCWLKVLILISLIHFADFRTYDKAWQVDNPGPNCCNLNHPLQQLATLYYSTAFVKGKYTTSAVDAMNNNLPITG